MYIVTMLCLCKATLNYMTFDDISFYLHDTKEKIANEKKKVKLHNNHILFVQ